jgi:tricorn protease
MTSSSYLRFPHVHGDLVTFVAEDDVWIAPLSGGRAWRVSSLQLPARNPRFTPDGKKLVWTVVQGTAPEVVIADVDGGGYRQLTFFGHSTTRVKGFTPGGDIVVTSAFRQAESRHTHAYRLSTEGGWAEELPLGPVESVAFGPELGDEKPVVVGSVLSREPAWWKRYRGGTAGKLWIDGDGNGEFERFLPELDGNLADPMWVDGRIAFLSDHEGYGNLYSVLPGGGDLRRHTDHEDFYVRHASTDGKRVIFESAGELWLLHDLGSEAVRLDITLGSASQGRRPSLLKVSKHLGDVRPDTTGEASAVEAHGTIHWLRHKDGPSRVVEATAGVRARLPRPLPDGRIAYVADHDGDEALFIREIAPQVPAHNAVHAAAKASAAAKTACCPGQRTRRGSAGSRGSGSSPAQPCFRRRRRGAPRHPPGGRRRCGRPRSGGGSDRGCDRNNGRPGNRHRCGRFNPAHGPVPQAFARQRHRSQPRRPLDCDRNRLRRPVYR